MALEYLKMHGNSSENLNDWNSQPYLVEGEDCTQRSIEAQQLLGHGGHARAWVERSK